LIASKQEAYHSRDLIKLQEIPQIDDIQLDNFKLELDFDKYKQVLVNQYGLDSFGKILDELKKKLATPMQSSLF
jgi:hypothetical protein